MNPTRLSHWQSSGNAMLAAGLRVPLNADHLFNAFSGLGSVKEFQIRDGELFGLLEVVGQRGAEAVTANDVSVGIDNFLDGNGRAWTDVLTHVAVTQWPVVPGLGSAIAASQLSAVYLSATPSKTNVPQISQRLTNEIMAAMQNR